eukprot:g8968.t1
MRNSSVSKSVVLDSSIIENVLAKEFSEDVFSLLSRECLFTNMVHLGGNVPRLVCIQGEINQDGDAPIYRHPIDKQPKMHEFSRTVNKIRHICSSLVGHNLNHALIQLYRTGEDYISEHADKTIDIQRGSSIVNFSTGATRTMLLRSKRMSNSGRTPIPRKTIRVPLPHNSLFVLGWNTNLKMTHAIRPDKRPMSLRSEDEKAYNCSRISITFRNVATYITREGFLYGQGAVFKLKKTISETIKPPQGIPLLQLVKAFSQENRNMDFDWDSTYAKGSNVISFPSDTGATHSVRHSFARVINCLLPMLLFVPIPIFRVTFATM